MLKTGIKSELAQATGLWWSKTESKYGTTIYYVPAIPRNKFRLHFTRRGWKLYLNGKFTTIFSNLKNAIPTVKRVLWDYLLKGL